MTGKRLCYGLPFLLVLVLATSPLIEAQNLAQIYDVDDAYAKSVPAGEVVSFVWLVYNKDASDVLLRTQAAPDSGTVWSAGLSPRSVILEPGGSAEVNLTVSAGLDAVEESVSIEVTLTLARAGDPTVNETVVRQATVNLVSAPSPLPTGNLILGIFPNPLPPPFDSRAVTFVINMAIWAAIAGAIVLVITPIVRTFAKGTKTELDDLVLGVIRGPILLLVLAFGVVQSVALLEPPPEISVILAQVYAVALVVVLAWLSARILRGVLSELNRSLTTRVPAIGSLVPVFNQLGIIFIAAIAGASIAAVFGFDLTGFIVGVGVVGFAIAFAARESISNFFNGIFLMVDRPFKEGDLIEIDGDRCRVIKIGLRSTVVYNRPTSKLLVIPNNKMAGETIVNLVEPDLAIRQSTTVGVEYGSDVETVKTILADAAKENPWVISDEPRREPYARLEEFGDSALIFKMKFWVSDADKLNRVRGQVNETIVQRLTEAGIVIPPPQIAVTLEEGEKKPTEGSG
ncbi:MAG: mechanosensitive ion channel family protein [Candidatus Thermoplasmatota archaeon]|nr:mechanosensitive ion channel family protein [Candidatus Thermoplasmatota archaeon]